MHRRDRSRRYAVVVVPFVPVGLVAAALVLGACSTSPEPAQSPADVESRRTHALARLDDSAAVVMETRSQIPDDVAARARCVVIVPQLAKGALLGGPGLAGGVESGRGFATCHTRNGWSAPTPVVLGGGWSGARIGFQHTDVLALLMSDGAVRALESGRLEVGVSAAAAAGPTGASREATETDILAYSRSSGVFAGATLNGTGVGPDEDATQALYGSRIAMATILGGQVPRPQEVEAARFSAAIRKAFPATPRVAQSSR